MHSSDRRRHRACGRCGRAGPAASRPRGRPGPARLRETGCGSRAGPGRWRHRALPWRYGGRFAEAVVSAQASQPLGEAAHFRSAIPDVVDTSGSGTPRLRRPIVRRGPERYPVPSTARTRIGLGGPKRSIDCLSRSSPVSLSPSVLRAQEGDIGIVPQPVPGSAWVARSVRSTAEQVVARFVVAISPTRARG